MEYRYTVNRVLRQTEDELRSVAHEEAEIEARELVMHSLGVESRAELAASVNKEMNSEQYAELREYILRRKTGEPLQYILGFWEFMGLRFKTDARALIPRQDTETLCEEAIALIKRRGYKTCLDLCAGSGCIGISIANICGTEVTLADISEAALSLCRENAEANGVSTRTIKTDMLDEITDKYDIIVCNPPYLTANDMASLQRELTFEPANALYGGEDGLDFYRRIAREAPDYLLPGGWLLLEIGSAQAEAVSALLAERFEALAVYPDMQGLPRAVAARLRECARV